MTGLQLKKGAIISQHSAATHDGIFRDHTITNLMAFFQNNLGKPAPERLNHSGF